MTIQQRRNQRRVKKLTGALVLVSGAGDTADLRYATGYSAVDPAVYVRTGKHKCLITPVLEKGRARREVHRGITVLTPLDLALTKTKRRRLSCWIEGAAKKEKVRRITVSAWCPAGIVERLRRSGFHVCVSTQPLFPERAVKLMRETAAIADAQKAAVHAYKQAVHYLKQTRISSDEWLTIKGRKVTAEDVRRVIDQALLDFDCVGSGTIVACGAQGADPHERGRGPLRANRPIVLDIFPQSRKTGYWGDLTRTIVRGKANARTKKMFKAVKAAHSAALRNVKQGVSAKGLYDVAQRVLESAGFQTRMKSGNPQGFIHSLGHGVGLDIHEAPAVGPVDEKLQAGNVVTIEPGLYYREAGGVRIEDTILVTRQGYRMLCKAGIRLEI